MKLHKGEKALVAAALGASLFGSWLYYKLKKIDPIASSVAVTALAGAAMSYTFRPSPDAFFEAAREDKNAKKFHDQLTTENREAFRILWLIETGEDISLLFKRFGFEKFSRHKPCYQNLLANHPDLACWLDASEKFPEDFDIASACAALPLTADDILDELVYAADIHSPSTLDTYKLALAQVRQTPISMLGIDMTQHQSQLVSAALFRFARSDDATPKNLIPLLRILPCEITPPVKELVFWRLVGGGENLIQYFLGKTEIHFDTQERAEGLVDVKAMVQKAAQIRRATEMLKDKPLNFGNLTWIFTTS